MRRTFIVAVVAAVAWCGAAVAAWLGLVHATADATVAQARLAIELLDHGATVDERLAQTLVRPGVHIRLVDRAADQVIDATNSGLRVRPRPPDALPPRGAGGFEPPRDGPPRDGPPLDGPQREAPLPGRPLRPGTNPGGLDGVALALAHIQPAHVERGARVADITPDARFLAQWLLIDALLLVAGVAGIAGVAAERVARTARAERRRIEAQSEERRDAAERYQRFLAEAGHELRTPLTVMAGYVQILRNHAPSAPIDERVIDGLQAETARMRILVEKILTLARLDSTAAVPRLIDHAEATREAVETAQRRFAGRDVAIRSHASGSIVIDADDYAAALGNLLENAVKYAPASPIVVETDVRNQQAVASVIDHGPGIMADERAAIFERFYRGRSGAGDGLGIGLAIVKRVADRWNGHVDLESGAGRTVFTLSFPLADEERHAVTR